MGKEVLRIWLVLIIGDVIDPRKYPLPYYNREAHGVDP